MTTTTTTTKDSLFCSTVHKASPATPLGLHLWAPPGAGTVLIVHIADHGLFANKLKAGMQIHRINGILCAGMSVQAIEQYLQGLSGRVSVMTKSPSRLGFCLASPRLVRAKTARNTSCGKSLQAPSDDKQQEDDTSVSSADDDEDADDSFGSLPAAVYAVPMSFW